MKRDVTDRKAVIISFANHIILRRCRARFKLSPKTLHVPRNIICRFDTSGVEFLRHDHNGQQIQQAEEDGSPAEACSAKAMTSSNAESWRDGQGDGFLVFPEIFDAESDDFKSLFQFVDRSIREKRNAQR